MVFSSDEQSSANKKIAIEKLIESLMRFMITPTDSQSVTTTVESLKWLLHLVNKLPELVLIKINFLLEKISLF